MSVARLVADPKARPPVAGSRVAGLAPCLPQRMAVRRCASGERVGGRLDWVPI